MFARIDRHLGNRGCLTAVVAVFAVTVCAGAEAGDASSRLRVDEPATYSDPAWAPRGGRIAFVRTTGDHSTIALEVMNIDGSGARQIVRQPPLPGQRPVDGEIAWPSWAPGGRRLVFGDSRIYVVGLDGSRLRLVAAGFCCAAWGPGGHKIAISFGEGQSDILVMNPDGSGKRIVASPFEPFSYWGPTWSPHGQKLAFYVDVAPDQFERPATSIGVIDRFNGPIHHLAVGHRYEAEPAWSPNGRKIAFDGIRVLDLRTRRITFLHPGQHPSWSPDSRRIAFENQGGIYVMNADGSLLHQLRAGDP